ncbi:agmatine deiminase [Pseudomonas citronellolis]|uniref:agmatine deiminase n=1 Tax=Pseudomonas citronellolis TaxID=53408 RepID=UPI0020A1B6EB|nr:agmatine deiminase [Pseudomonas citronellolis]MCP1644713.1 agmatine deiminase [Pseudomonas citronellolis]MCP1665098.1 agmatine deiminase [Pseudomonas citronellolis]MCP1698867.1 agmatine deiminase [Pseudomonas citronellolis]MCP1705527.1 agmatine deiminase [Pseudomonas citronellolis]MCP1799532.1 agmatine deiminase [Pseudomonas citronellolis]
MTTLTSTPRADGFRMPAEWEPHTQTWMVWPERPDNWRLGGKPAQAAFSAVAEAIARFEPVTVCVSAAQFENARARLSDAIRVIEISNDDAWVRDTGPTFVVDDQGGVRGVDWTFNSWGGLDGGLYFPWLRDDQVAAKILQVERCDRYRTEGFVLEGGSIHVDGEGTLITTEECLLNRNRNPHLSREEIEQVLREHLAVDSVIWLPDGLYNDETNGHVDNFCCYVRPGEVLLAWTDDANDPNYPRCQAAMRVLEQARDAKGRQLVVHKMPIPGPLHATEEECASVDLVEGSQERDPSIRLAGSYVNFLIVNGGIVAPSFDDPKDAEAKAILQRVFPEHEVVMVPGREILLGGGNIHCITQQQPTPQKR